MSTLLLLRSAINVSTQFGSRINREQQYINGIKSLEVLGLDKKFNDVWVVDNTFSASQQIPKSIQDLLPQSWSILYTETNKFGALNKGAGDVETLQSLAQEISQYDYLFFHELRLKIKQPDLILKFLDNPGNYLYRETSSWKGIDLYTPKKSLISGHYGISSHHMTRFLEGIDLQQMVQSNSAIEELLYRYAVESHIKFMSRRKYCMRYLEISNKYVSY